jgi:tryptophan-rich hypothetical protein
MHLRHLGPARALKGGTPAWRRAVAPRSAAAAPHGRAAAAPSDADDFDGDDDDEGAPPAAPLFGSFVRAPQLVNYQRTRACGRCAGTAAVPCAPCSGTGRLPPGGYNARNPVNAARVVGTKWTAMQRTLGWRHFRVLQRRREGKGEAFVLLAATCDERTQLWVSLGALKDRRAWAAGWLQKTEMRALEDAAGGAGPSCRACRGAGAVTCPLCAAAAAGDVVEL